METPSAHPESALLPTNQVATAIEDIEDFIDCMKSAEKARLASVMGPTRVGKTSICEAICEAHKPVISDDETRMSVLFVSVGGTPTVRGFFDDILEAMGVPSRPRDTIGVVKRRVRTFLERFKVEILILDEFQHLKHTRGLHQEGVCDTIKSIMNEGRSIIAMGNEDIEEVIGYDPQLMGRRILDLQLYPFCDPANPRFLEADGDTARQVEFDEYNGILKHFSESLGCTDTGYILKLDVARELLRITTGLYGKTFDLVRHAARFEKRRGSAAITHDGLMHAQRRMLREATKKKDSGFEALLNEAKGGAPGNRKQISRDARKSLSLVDEKYRKGRKEPSGNEANKDQGKPDDDGVDNDE